MNATARLFFWLKMKPALRLRHTSKEALAQHDCVSQQEH